MYHFTIGKHTQWRPTPIQCYYINLAVPVTEAVGIGLYLMEGYVRCTFFDVWCEEVFDLFVIIFTGHWLRSLTHYVRQHKEHFFLLFYLKQFVM